MSRTVRVAAAALLAGVGSMTGIAQDLGLGEQIPPGLAWRDFGPDYTKNVQTRFGALEVIRLGPDDERASFVEFRLDGELIAAPIPRRDDFFLVSFESVFPFRDRDVVLAEATSGGSGSPPPQLLLIQVNRNGTAELVIDPEFRSSDWTQRVATDGERMFFDLGYHEARRKSAVFADGRLEVFLDVATPTPLPESRCQWLHHVTGQSACTLRQGLPNSVLRTLRALEHRPGFTREPFIEACELAGQRGEAPPYEAFRLDVCEVR
jgi:hypothetical protein